MTKLHIKNMVCPRCILAIEKTLNDLNISAAEIRLGEVVLNENITPEKLLQFQTRIENLGFELLDDKNAALINQIKTIIIQHIQSKKLRNLNFSEILASELHKEYSQLSKLFSATMGMTIEQFTILQKTEKIKELLVYDELSLKEIALQLDYSSAAHLSAQFKKTTGLTPTAFKKLNEHNRQSLDKIWQFLPEFYN